MNLNSLRLNMIADMIPSCKCLADIGTDHALLPVYLTLNNRCEKAIASDVKEGPLKAAKRNIVKYNLEDRIELRQGSGLKTIKKDECEAAVLAGMGGYLITELLAESMEVAASIPYLLVQPNTEEDTVRKFLYDNGFYITDENAVFEGKRCYLAIMCRYGPGLGGQYEPLQLCTGKILYNKKTQGAHDYYRNMRKKTEKIIKGIEASGSNDGETQKKLQEHKNLLEWIDENAKRM